MKELGFICLLLLGLPMKLTGQDAQLYGSIPMILVKRDLKDQLDLSVTLSSEMHAFDRKTGGERYSAKVLNLNLESALSYDANPNLNLATGFLFRLRDPFTGTTTELRPWQQITDIRRLGKYRVRNRLRAEERWVGSQPDFDLRLRYRISTDFPLAGERLDNREFYLNLSTEALLTPTRKMPWYFWEHRTYLGLGYQINDRHRLEPALDFRTRKMDATGRSRRILFLRLIWVSKWQK